MSFLNPESALSTDFFLHFKNYSKAAIVPQGCIPTSNNQNFIQREGKITKKKKHFFEFARISCSLRPSLRVENLSGLNMMHHYSTCREGHDEF